MEKQYPYQSAQKVAQEFWAQEEIYATGNNNGPLYSIDTPPPTVSGNLHIGHIFSYTQTDIIARYKRLNGFDVFYPFGFDDNGLATERFVEKKREISAHTMSRSEFIKICLEVSHQAEQEFKELWQSIGLSANWNKCYSTISDPVRRLSQLSFIELYKKGYIYRKNEPALYCTTCRTSVAQAELDDAQKETFFNDIVFKDFQGNDLVVATTRPELLYSVNALLYHPADIRYGGLEGTYTTVPIYGHKVPILTDDAVLPDKGTGLVMTSTFGDKMDVEWFKKLKLEYRPSIGLDGKFLPQTGILAGLSVFHARERIIQELKNQGLLLKQIPIKHSVNVHERCKKEIEYLMLSQWFLHILKYKKDFLALANLVRWWPEHMKVRYQNWVENLSWDWCLSRQRFYGIPFPAWHCTSCKHVIIAKPDQLPIDPQEMAYKGKCPSCKGGPVIADTDVMDTWNTSSITPYICYELFSNKIITSFDDKKILKFIPMSMRPQAHDIIRTWAFYTLVKSWMHNDTIAWTDIVISGHVLSDAKEKISKSKGNDSRTPQKLLEQYPADAIRYWTASGSLGIDISFSDAQIKIGMRLITKLWNALRFINEHISILDTKPVINQPLGAVNEWLLDTLSTSFAKYQSAFERHEFSAALLAVENFFWHDFCDNYLELIKDQLFNPNLYSEQQSHATRTILYHAGLRILQLYAPFLPHITETLYQEIYRKYESEKSIHQTAYVKLQIEYEFSRSAQLMKSVNEIIAQVRKLKTEQQLSLKTPLEQLSICSDNSSLLDQLQTQEQLIKGVTHALSIEYKSEKCVSLLKQKENKWDAQISI